MNKSRLVSEIAENVNLTKIDVKKVVDALFDCIEKNLNAGERIMVSGFGVFSVSNSPERVGRNPRTGESVRIAPRRSVKFRSSMEIK